MKSNFEKTAAWGRGWQASGNWKPHTMGHEDATNAAYNYLKFIQDICGGMPLPGKTEGMDVGAGAGFFSAAFTKFGINMVATEWNDDGINLIRQENPQLQTRKIDVLTFHEPTSKDFIFCRELYPFTRVNAFTDQYETISRLIDSLKPGGVLVIVGSDILRPHCADWELLIRSFRTDKRLALVSARYLELLMRRRKYWGRLGCFGYWTAAAILWPFLAYKKRFHSWALISAIVFRKK